MADIYRVLQANSGVAKPEVAEQLRHEALQSPGAFAGFLRNVPLDCTCVLFEVYEVLLQDPRRFTAILLSELARLLERAKADPHNRSIYDALSAFELVQDDELKASIAAVLIESLQSSQPQVRRFSADLAGDCLLRRESALGSRLHSALAHDADWRVRLLAYYSLRDHLQANDPARAAELRLSPLDRVRNLLSAQIFHHWA